MSGVIGDLVCAGSRVPEGAEVKVDVVLESVVGGVVVTGRVEAPWEGECRRCLAPASGLVSIAVRELYEAGALRHGRLPGRAEPMVGRGALGGCAGDDEASEDTYRMEGDDLDLEVLARDAVLLQLPIAPLCRPDCLGLCPRCGADLNELAARGGDGRCSCQVERDPRWSALDSLLGGS